MSATLSPLARTLAGIAARAGAVIMRHYAAGTEARRKADHSPVTEADEEAERLILAALAKAAPGVPVIAEEEMAAGRVTEIGRRFFLVDPLDGTREFLRRNGEFTVNIGEVMDRMPVRGVVYAPALARLFVGELPGAAFEIACAPDEMPDFARARRIAARAPGSMIVAAASRSHRDAQTDAFLAAQGAREIRTIGSSLKFCLVAAGEADLYPRTGRTMEWDTAAAHAVLAAAGGSVTQWDGAPLFYAKPGFENPAFIARGRPHN